MINGTTYSGKNVGVVNGKVKIDGKDVTPNGKQINILVEGDINELSVDSAEKIGVNGNVNTLTSTNGNVDVNGHVEQFVK